MMTPESSEDSCARAAREWLEHGNRTIYSLAKLLREREAAARAEEREQAAQTLEALGRPDFLDDVAAAGFFHARRTGVAAIRSRAAQEKPQ